MTMVGKPHAPPERQRTAVVAIGAMPADIAVGHVKLKSAEIAELTVHRLTVREGR